MRQSPSRSRPQRTPGIVLAMIALLSLLLSPLGSAADPADKPASTAPILTFRLTNDDEFRKAFDQTWNRRPTTPVYDKHMLMWMSAASDKANFLRANPLAEAITREMTMRWPHDWVSWANLSSYLAKRGQFEEATEAIQRAMALPGHDENIVRFIMADLLWLSGKKEASGALLGEIQQPHDKPQAELAWHSCRAFYHALTDDDRDVIRQSIAAVQHMPGSQRWMDVFRRDPIFDRYRMEPWFIDLVGRTAEGTPPASAIHAVAGEHVCDDLVPLIPHDDDMKSARAVLVDIVAQCHQQKWDKVPGLIASGRSHGIELPEYIFIEALERSIRGDITGAMDAIRRISHEEFELADRTCDILSLYYITEATVKALAQSAAIEPAKRSNVAAGLIIMSHVLLSVRHFDDAIKSMDSAAHWDPTLAEVYNTRGIARFCKSDLTGAEADYRKALALRADFGDPQLNLSEIFARRGQLVEASSSVDLAIAMGSDYPFARAQRAKYLAARGDAAGALAQIEELANHIPMPPRSLSWRCWEISSRCTWTRHFKEAEQLTRLAITLSPDFPNIWTKLSGDLARQGKYTEALEAVDQALSMGPPDAIDANIGKATWLWKSGKQAEAKLILEQLRKPEGEWESALFSSSMAVYAAQSGNEDLLRSELAKVFAFPPGIQEDPREWIRGEIFFDAYRDKDWFKELATGALPSGRSDPRKL